MIVIFETLRWFHWPVAAYYLWRGAHIHVFDFTYDLKRNPLLRALINAGRIERIYIRTMAKEHGEAIDQTEIVFKKLKHHYQKILKRVSDLYQSEEIELIFKKTLLFEIFRCIYIHNSLRGRSVLFIPDAYTFYESFIRQWGTYPFSSFEKVVTPRFFSGLAGIFRFFDSWRPALGGFCWLFSQFIFSVLFHRFAGKSSFTTPFKYAVAVHQEIEIKFDNKRRFDFLLDGRTLTPDNSVFLFFLPVIPPKDHHGVDAAAMKKWSFLCSTRRMPQLKKGLPALLALPLSLFSLSPFVWAYFRALFTYFFFQRLRGQVSFENYIYTNQESTQQIALNILIRNEGGTTWNYALFLGGGLLYVPRREDFSTRRHWLWAYLNSDHYVAVSRDAVEYSRTHFQHIRHYHVVGSLYSEMVRECVRENSREAVGLKWFGPEWRPGLKIVSFFDTSFIDSRDCQTTTFDDAISFYSDILRLMKETRDILFVIKAKKNEGYYLAPDFQWSSLEKGGRIVALWERLKQDGKVFWAGDRGDIPLIIAMSDLVVSYCYSSPTVEALGAGKKSLWYESRDNHAGLYYDSIPGLVVHGYEALVKRMHDLLYEESDEAYENYLKLNILGRVESHLDGRALTRLRQLLANPSGAVSQ